MEILEYTFGNVNSEFKILKMFNLEVHWFKFQ